LREGILTMPLIPVTISFTNTTHLATKPAFMTLFAAFTKRGVRSNTLSPPTQRNLEALLLLLA
jgi:hypothetical protein